MDLLDLLAIKYQEERQRRHPSRGAYNREVSELLERLTEEVAEKMGLRVDRECRYLFEEVELRPDLCIFGEVSFVVECKAMPNGLLFKPDALRTLLEAYLIQLYIGSPYVFISAYGSARRGAKAIVESSATRSVFLEVEVDKERALKRLEWAMRPAGLHEEYQRARERLSALKTVPSDLPRIETSVEKLKEVLKSVEDWKSFEKSILRLLRGSPRFRIKGWAGVTVEVDAALFDGKRLLAGVEIKRWNSFHTNDFKAALAEGLLWINATQTPFIVILNPGVRVPKHFQHLAKKLGIYMVHGGHTDEWVETFKRVFKL